MSCGVSSIAILRGSIEDNIVVLEEDVSDVPGVVGLLLLVVVHDGQVALVFGVIEDFARDHKILLRDCEEPLLIRVVEVDLQV